LAVIDGQGTRAGIPTLYLRWAIVWLPLFVPMLPAALLFRGGDFTTALVWAFTVLLAWIGGAIHAVIHPHRGLHDRLAGTWVVRR
jgi:hypothetical protein